MQIRVSILLFTGSWKADTPRRTKVDSILVLGRFLAFFFFSPFVILNPVVLTVFPIWMSCI